MSRLFTHIILAGLMFTAGECIAQLRMYALNTVPALYGNSALAAHDGILAVGTDDAVQVYQVEIDGDLVPIGVINEPDVIHLEFCNSYLVACTENEDYECGIVVYDVPGLTELSRYDADGLFHEWVTACGERLYVCYFGNELFIFTIGNEGEIVLEAQHDGLPLPNGGVPACNHELLSVVGIFDAYTVLDIVDPQNPVEVSGYVAYEDLYEIGFSEDGVFVSGVDHNPFAQGIRMLRYAGGEFELLSSAGGSMEWDFATKTDGDRVIVQSRPYPLFTDRLTLYRVARGEAISLQTYLLVNGNIANYVIDDPFVIIRDTELQQLFVYGIFGPPQLECQVLPDQRVLLTWQEIPEAESYKVYARATFNGERSLLLETGETRAVIPRQMGTHLFDVVSVRP